VKLVVVAGLAGLILAAVVCGWRSSGILSELSLLLWLSTGLWLGIAETILLAGMRRVARAAQAGIGERFAPWIWPTLAALLASPAIIALGVRFFSSPGSARLRFAPAGPALVAIVGTVAVFVSARLFIVVRRTARNVRRSIAGVVLVIATGILVGPARAIPPGCGYLCDAVMLTSFVLVQGALHLDVESLRLGESSAAMAVWALFVVLASSTVAVVLWPVSARKSAELRDDQNPTSHLASLWRYAIDFDGDGVSPVLGGGDCNDFDGSVNPLATEIPGDGIDQDCDGSDLTQAQAATREAFWRQRSRFEVTATAASAALRAAAARASIVLVSVDALRADRLWASAPSQVGGLGDLWRNSVRFERAYAPSSSTRLSLPMLATSRFSPATAASVATLPQRLRVAGYRTALVSFARPIEFVGDHRDEFHPPFDLRAGFDRVDLVPDQQTDAGLLGISREAPHDGQVVNRALLMTATLAHYAEPFFLRVHLFDLHEWEELIPAGPRDNDASRYDREAEAELAELGRLLEGLATVAGSRPIIVVLVADHGEALGERGYRHHTRFLYDFLVRVPFLIRAPGLASQTIREPVSLLDVAPTLLALVGAGSCDGCRGDDLVPLMMDEGTLRGRALLLRENNQVALIRNGWKLLFTPSANVVELYHLDDERLDAESSSSHPEVAREMLGLLRASPLRDLPPLSVFAGNVIGQNGMTKNTM
jgi:hypothetical protein